MGKRGPQPTPTKILEMRGSWRAKERPNEPKPKPGIPSKPSWLVGRVATAEWRMVTKQLDEMGVLSKLDRTAVAMYCDAVQDFADARKELRKFGGTTFEDENGKLQQHPAVHVKQKASDRIKVYMAKLGLSPSDRSGLQVVGEDAVPEQQPKGKLRHFG